VDSQGIRSVPGDDGPLVRRVLEGDTAAYAGLVARYRDRLGRYAVRMLGNQADAEEALQDTFVRAYRSLARCTDADRFGAWIFGILVNRCRTHGAQRARRERTLVADETALARASVRDWSDGHAWRETIDWALAQLPPAHREAFLLKHVEDRSYEEMVELTGASVSALKMRVARAREMLQRLLREADRG
jgi:RNA polymerase sigma-70 factor (ECF subfamily)